MFHISAKSKEAAKLNRHQKKSFFPYTARGSVSLDEGFPDENLAVSF